MDLPPSSKEEEEDDDPLLVDVDADTKVNGATSKTATAARPTAPNLILTVMLLFNIFLAFLFIVEGLPTLIRC